MKNEEEKEKDEHLGWSYRHIACLEKSDRGNRFSGSSRYSNFGLRRNYRSRIALSGIYDPLRRGSKFLTRNHGNEAIISALRYVREHQSCFEFNIDQIIHGNIRRQLSPSTFPAFCNLFSNLLYHRCFPIQFDVNFCIKKHLCPLKILYVQNV